MTGYDVARMAVVSAATVPRGIRSRVIRGSMLVDPFPGDRVEALERGRVHPTRAIDSPLTTQPGAHERAEGPRLTPREETASCANIHPG
jgi:hypothetical protein